MSALRLWILAFAVVLTVVDASSDSASASSGSGSDASSGAGSGSGSAPKGKVPSAKSNDWRGPSSCVRVVENWMPDSGAFLQMPAMQCTMDNEPFVTVPKDTAEVVFRVRPLDGGGLQYHVDFVMRAKWPEEFRKAFFNNAIGKNVVCTDSQNIIFTGKIWGECALA